MQDELNKASHKVFRLKYHFVFCIKYRKDLFLDDKYINTIKEICLDIEKRYYIKFETVGFDEKHVHFMLQSAPKYSTSKIFQIVKSITAREIFKRHLEIKEELYNGEFWSDGGYVATVGEGVNADVIRTYIKNQGRKSEQLRLIDFI